MSGLKRWNCRYNSVRKKIKGSFWDSAWKRFINREINREEIKTILKHYYQKSSHSYKKMIKVINIEEKDYKKFIALLHKYKITGK